jgi:hypothetical protein
MLKRLVLILVYEVVNQHHLIRGTVELPLPQQAALVIPIRSQQVESSPI